MIADKREQVIANIKRLADEGRFNEKVEVDDPVFDGQTRQAVLERYLRARKTMLYRTKNFIACRMLDVITWKWNRDTRIVGLENVRGMKGGAIITSNHFNPDDNTIIRRFAQKMHKGKLCIVSQDTNLAMPGLVGFFMNYIDIIPISPDRAYMKKHFEPLIRERLARKQFVLIYPEQEMWFNYRKPRPVKRGAYYYAAKNNVPVISCFVEIRELPEPETAQFRRVQYILHVLKPIYPDPAKSLRESSMEMAERDYEQKKAAYENAYNRPLTYEFSEWDIAGWINSA